MKKLRVEDLYFSYTEEFIFEKLNFELCEGDGCTLLAGENGAGKSTLINVICNILECDGGLIEHNDLHIAYLPFESPLYPQLTVAENLRYFYRSFQGKDLYFQDEQVKKVLRALSINYLKQRFDRCSSGQQQKAGIAMILLSGADLIIMDEPFVAVDTASSERLVKLIEEMKQQTMFLITTHTLDKMRSLADHILYLKDRHMIRMDDEASIDNYFEEGILHDPS